MRILLTNDDGIFSPGLEAIYRLLAGIGQVTVVAPDASRSGSSHSITFNRPVVCDTIDVDGRFTGFSVEGSPADCVKLACLQLHNEPIDLMVAGINNGANAGINIYYSGTVAAAMEASIFGIPAVAMSLAVEDSGEHGDFDRAAIYCMNVLEQLMPVPNGGVINLNIPQLSRGTPKGVRAVPHCNRGFDEYYIALEDKQGRSTFQLAGGPRPNEGPPTDISSLLEGFITVTALGPGRTDHRRTEQLARIQWKTGGDLNDK